MANLPDTTTESGQREASRMLARLMPDWSVHNDWQITTPDGYGLRNLYKISEMALAWKVLNWAVKTVDEKKQRAMNGGGMDSWMYWHEGHFELRAVMLSAQETPPAEAMRTWLDKILALAVGAGMLDVTP